MFDSAGEGSGVAVYRAYNGNELPHDHNFTPDADEQDALVGYGWDDEASPSTAPRLPRSGNQSFLSG